MGSSYIISYYEQNTFKKIRISQCFCISDAIKKFEERYFGAIIFKIELEMTDKIEIKEFE